MPIPDTTKINQGQIPDSVAQVSKKEDIEAKPFVISYEYYNDKLCELRNLQKGAHRKILEDFRKIGSLTNITQFQGNNIDCDDIKDAGEYSKLFNKLPPDIELKENAIQGKARFFYFIVERFFHLVAIKNKHFETRKIRR